jgi:hypothetical protein
MSNGRYTYCPFYIDENKRSISCEDVCRHFSSLDEKYGWMRQYCDTMEWEKCPFAVDLTEAYYRKEKGDEKALEKEKIKAMESEIRSLSTKLGTAEKRNERLHQVNELMMKKLKKASTELEDYQKHESERYFRMAMLYEDRIAYLIDTCCDGRLAEADVKAWAEGKEYALTFDKDEEDPVWIVKTRKETEADEDVSEPVQGAAEDEGPAVKK